MDALSRAEFGTLAVVAFVCCAALVYAWIGLRRLRVAAAESIEPAPPQMFSLAVPVGVLLPAELPVVDGLRLSASFVAGDGASGGGDFYDAFQLDDGTIALAVGDAAGSGLAAVAIMNVARQAIRNALFDGARPADALRRTNRMVLRADAHAIVTAVVAIFDPATLQLRYACAGHAPPILAGPDGEFAALPAPASDIALGIVPHHVTAELTATVPVDALLAFYTDGCVQVDRDPVAGTQAFGEAVAGARTLMPTKPAVAIDRAIFGRRERTDDATIITVFPEPTLEHVDVRLPAESASTALARTALRRFFASTQLDERRTYDALVAIGEAVSNAIEHAYAGRPNQTFSLRARSEGAVCVVVVEDGGVWRQDAGEPWGRGVSMMRRLSDECAIDRSASGTSVMLRFALAPRLADAALVDSVAPR
jgi:anti-sigma regulatory factor (Ser/Thr protein kinase)